MRYYLLLFSLLFCTAVKAQVDTSFVLVVDITDAQSVTDSTFQVELIAPADQLGYFTPIDIDSAMGLIDGNGRLFTVIDVIASSFSDATLLVVCVEAVCLMPAQVGAVYRKRADNRIPVPANGATGVSEGLQTRIHLHNILQAYGSEGDFVTLQDFGDTLTVLRDTFTDLRSSITALQNAGYVDGVGVNTRVPFFTDANTLSTNSLFNFDNANARVGIGLATPLARLHIQTNGLGTTQTTASGLLLQNTTDAASGAQQISPPITWDARGWKTSGTAASQSVAFRADVTPVQGTTNPSGRWGLGAAINGGTYLDNIISATSDGTQSGTTVDINGKLTLRMDDIGAAFNQARSLHLLNTTAATLAVNQVPPLIVYQADGWKTGAPAGTSTIFGEIGFSPLTGINRASSNFFVRGTLGSTGAIDNLINVQTGAGSGTAKVMVGAYNTFSASSGILLGVNNTLSSVSMAIGTDVVVSGGTLGLGTYVTASHASAGVLGSNIVSGGADTWIFGRGGGITERGFTASGTALIHYTGGTAQLRIQGLPTVTENAWTAAGAVITITTPNADIAVGQGIALMGTIGADISYRTIIAVSSTTVFTVSSAPLVASGTSLRTQTLNILEVGNGGDSYNQHMIVDRSGLVGLGITPTARLTLAAGTTLVAPVQLAPGTNLTTPINGALEFDGTNYFVTSSSTRHILSKTLTGTGVLNFGSIASLATETLTITVTGAAIGDVVLVGIDNGSKSTGLIFGQPWVSATNTISIEAYNSTGSAIDPASGTFSASVIKY